MNPSAPLPLSLYLDDCAFDYDLVAALQSQGRRVVTPKDAGLLGADDDVHLAYATGAGLAVITKDATDFRQLHLRSGSTAAVPRHAGILAVYQDDDPAKDMTPADIARAIANLLAAGVPIAGEFHVLNHWRY